MKKIKTTRGETLLIDDEDYDRAIKYKWTVTTSSNRRQVFTYANRRTVLKPFSSRGVSYKKLILGINGKMTLFKNDNPLDLRRENIMVFDSKSEFVSAMGKIYRKKNPEFNYTKSKASQGKAVYNKRNSKYIGVRYEGKNTRKWFSAIRHNWKIYHLGCFLEEEDAALAYDQKAIELYGPDAKRNFPHLTIEKITKRLNKVRAEGVVLYSTTLSKCHQGVIYKNVSKTSRYVGVCMKEGRYKCWRATINHNGKQYSLGRFLTEEEAAMAYDKKAIELFGKNVRLNFPDKAGSVFTNDPKPKNKNSKKKGK